MPRAMFHRLRTLWAGAVQRLVDRPYQYVAHGPELMSGVSSDRRALPDFALIGAMRCGTTSLCELLGQHVDILVSDPKEPNFYSRDENFAKGFDWYASLFPAASPRHVLGEGSPSYSNAELYPRAAQRLAQHAPGCRILYSVRHPLRRIESEWRQRRRWGTQVGETFSQTLRDYPLVESSLYWKQICRYRDHFPDEQILILFFEDFVADPHAELARCFRHLGVDQDPGPRPGAAIPKNAAVDWRTDSELARFLRRLPMSERVWNAVPSRLRDVVRPALSRPLLSEQERNPTWDDRARQLVIDRLQDDTRALLRHCGKPDCYWALGE